MDWLLLPRKEVEVTLNMKREKLQEVKYKDLNSQEFKSEMLVMREFKIQRRHYWTLPRTAVEINCLMVQKIP